MTEQQVIHLVQPFLDLKDKKQSVLSIIKELNNARVNFEYIQAENSTLPDIIVNYKTMFLKGSVEKLQPFLLNGMNFKIGFCLQSKTYCAYEANSAIALASADSLSSVMGKIAKTCSNNKLFGEFSKYLLNEFKLNKSLQDKYKESLNGLLLRSIV